VSVNQQLQNRYGNQHLHANVEAYLTSDDVREFFGPRCSDYEPLCACCKAWIQWNETGKVTFTVGRTLALKLIRDDE
jgi:hypothetical protein